MATPIVVAYDGGDGLAPAATAAAREVVVHDMELRGPDLRRTLGHDAEPRLRRTPQGPGDRLGVAAA